MNTFQITFLLILDGIFALSNTPLRTIAKYRQPELVQASRSDKIFYHQYQHPQPPAWDIHYLNELKANPLLGALLVSSSLGISPKSTGLNHPELPPLNPYIALLLSHYGRYTPIYGKGNGIYSYVAANNYHNNKPFGSYKIYEDADS